MAYEGDHLWGIDHLIQNMVKGQAVTVSNGSFMEQAGAAAWTIEGKSVQHQIIGKGITPGDTQDQSASKSELFDCGAIFSL